MSHKSYNPDNRDNDFAIIQLIFPVTFSDRVRPICLPAILGKYDNKVATVTGWGLLATPDGSTSGSLPNILQKVIMNQQEI